MKNYLQDIENTQKILGDDILECLKNIFIHLDGEPHRVEKKRYRANNPKHMALLDTLEQKYQFIYIERIKNKDFYLLKSYVLPLIETNKSKALLKAMSEIYSLLPALYSERLDESILVKELFEISNLKKDIFLEALFYLFQYHDVWTGKTLEFPYKKDSSFQISEQVLLKEFLQTATDYYRWNILNEDNNNAPKKPNIDTEINDQKTGRPTFKNEIIDAYEQLKKENIINFDMKFVSHVGVIQDKIIELNPTINDIKGLDYKTLSKHLGAKFKADKKSQN